MGRGRAKAKQTKVARELKYSTPDLDPDRLRQELASDGITPSPASTALDDADDEAEPYDDPYGDASPARR